MASPDLQLSSGGGLGQAPQIDDCKICGVQKVNLQEHVFSSGHIAQVKALLANGGNMGPSPLDDPSADTSPSITPTPMQKPQSVAASIIGGLYNQFLMQQQNQQQQHEVTAAINMMNTSGGSANSSASGGDLMANLNNLQQQQLENNLLLQINADQQTNTPSTTNSEILQQLYNYSQMSGELIK